MNLSSMSIAEIAAYIKALEFNQIDTVMNMLSKDERTGVQKLLLQLKKRIEKEEKEQKRLAAMYCYERELIEQGMEWIAGVDEVGRGPLAGPVVAAAVILPKNCVIPGVDDSKKLSEQKRQALYHRILDIASAVGVGLIDHDRIDKINILNATYEAMTDAVNQMQIRPDFILVDAVTIPRLSYPQKGIIKGDSKSISIAAASIVAKVVRDQLMVECHEQYPHYQFDKNKGYGTSEHIAAIQKFGLTPIHRKTFTKNF